jgi:ribokinase
MTKLFENRDPMKIVVVGSLNMDLVIKMTRIPKPGETLLGGNFKTFPGGKGANQAVAAARMRTNVCMVGCVGKDAFGSELITSLEKDEINTSHILKHPTAATGVALIQVDFQGHNSIAVAPGANYELTGLDVEKALQNIGDFDVLVLQLEIPVDTVYSAISYASQKGIKIILNPAPARVLDQNILKLVDFLVPNEYELAIMIDEPGLSESLIDQHLSNIRELGSKNFVVTMGQQGAVIIGNADQIVHIPAYTVQAVDTTAAGDCFVGALAVALCEGQSLAACVAFASAAAALSVTREGAQPSLPLREAVLKFKNERNETL